jgi:SAM-dependent methyltransferase
VSDDPSGRSDRTGLPFGQVAEFYDRARPGYPDAVIADILDLCRVPTRRVLEVGAGTGRATGLLARQDLDVVAIEPSPEMAAHTRRACAPYPRVRVIVATFEDWPAEEEAFDLVVSAQAWHWTSPHVRYHKANSVLRHEGGLALFWNHPRWDQSPATPDLAAAYQQWAPELADKGPWFPGFSGLAGAERPTATELAGTFEPLTERRYPWETTYTTDNYLELLRSLPEHETLPPHRLRGLLEGIADAINSNSNSGTLALPYETRLYFTRRI